MAVSQTDSKAGSFLMNTRSQLALCFWSSEFSLTVQWVCASRAICTAVLSWANSRGLKPLTALWRWSPGLQTLPDLLCNASDCLLHTCSARMRCQNEALSVQFLISSHTVKKEHKAVSKSFWHHVCSQQEKAFKHQAVNEFLFSCLQTGWGMDTGSRASPPLCSLFSRALPRAKTNPPNPRRIFTMIHSQTFL